MANDSTATLPLPGTSPDNPLGMPPPTTQTPMRPPDPSRIQILKELLTKYGPAFANMMQGSQQQQGPTGVTPAVVPPVVSRQSTLPALEVKFDPMSVVGSLPQPVAQPQKGGYEPPAGTSELLSKLDPQSALTFSGIQGVTKFLQDNAQKKDQEKHAEHGERERRKIASCSESVQRNAYRPNELHCRNQAHGQPIERQIERRVHYRKTGAEADEQKSRSRVGLLERPPWLGPRRKDHGGGCDPHPGDAKDADRWEKQHGEGGTEIMEYGTHAEPSVRRSGMSDLGER